MNNTTIPIVSNTENKRRAPSKTYDRMKTPQTTPTTNIPTRHFFASTRTRIKRSPLLRLNPTSKTQSSYCFLRLSIYYTAHDVRPSPRLFAQCQRFGRQVLFNYFSVSADYFSVAPQGHNLYRSPCRFSSDLHHLAVKRKSNAFYSYDTRKTRFFRPHIFNIFRRHSQIHDFRFFIRIQSKFPPRNGKNHAVPLPVVFSSPDRVFGEFFP